MKPTHCFCASVLLAVVLQAGAAEHEIKIVQYAYQPAELEIARGETVIWVNREKRTSHSILIGGEESERLFPGERWSRRFDEAGRFEYRCGPHPEMSGLIIVRP